MPITDVRDLVAFDHVDINTSAVSLLSRNGVVVHLLDHYGNYAGSVTPAEDMVSATVLRAQVSLTADAETRRKVSYDELLHLEALKIVRLCLEDKPYKPFHPWW